ncbi:hypothetical protein [Paenibacillus sp. 32O-W]|uniref:hypothetical protein n=1 Tax=Paenibacillus sp. 32O-W TaxID=1695218 RepID=UPI000AC837E6|nr:hypothetical protein [Paenibacillus sp. 32O-W]
MWFYKKSTQIENSWKFIENITSEEFAKATQASGMVAELPARELTNIVFDNINLKAFYEVKPADAPEVNITYDKQLKIYELATKTFRESMDKNISSSEMLDDLENQMQAILSAS